MSVTNVALIKRVRLLDLDLRVHYVFSFTNLLEECYHLVFYIDLEYYPLIDEYCTNK